ncbi:hypothetical protein Aduo_003541 [Ancylostoma duodenale]
MIRALVLLSLLSPTASAVKCLDCVGKDCMGSFCEGDYCMLSQYAPRWGTIEWGKPEVVKGCMTGSLLRDDIRDHCETADEQGKVDIRHCVAPVITRYSVALVITRYSVAPVITRYSVAPVITPHCVAPMGTQRCVAPVDTRHCVTPVITRYSVAPVITRYSVAPVITLHCVAPVITPHCVASVITRYSGAPVITPHCVAPMGTQRCVAPVDIRHCVAPVITLHCVAPVITRYSVAPVITPHCVAPMGTQRCVAPVDTRHCVAPMGTLHCVAPVITPHCVASEVFTCFCNGRDNCNGGRALQRLEVEPVELLTCVCSGKHCKDDTCIGEMCSYVINHRTKEIEQGCVNASVPLVERRSMGACMIPPITGAMHHTVAKDASDLLKTESCVCAKDYCNAEKPEITVPEKQKCQTFVNTKVMGTQMSSKNVTCTGEFCFKARIKSKLGHMTEYNTIGCASFTGDDPLAEELNPTGCAKFSSEQLEVTACFETKDRAAIGRARANQEVREPKRKPSKTKSKSKKPPPKMEIEYDEEEEEEEENNDEEEEKQQRKPSKPKPKEEEVEEEKPKEKEPPPKPKQQEEGEEKSSELDKDDDDDGDDEEQEGEETTVKNFIFERPTQPPIPDDSNTTMIAVFILIMLCIVVSGAVWKFELHKKLFRSSYDTVAGG